MSKECNEVTHHARNGVLALRGQLIALQGELYKHGVADKISLDLINSQVNRIGKAISGCKPPPINYKEIDVNLGRCIE